MSHSHEPVTIVHVTPPAFEGEIVLHSSREFTCSESQTAEECLWYQHYWHFWYVADWAFGRSVVYFYCAAIGFFGVLRLVLAARQSSPKIICIPGYRLTSSLWRGIFGRRFKLGSIYTPTLGVMSLIGSFLIFTFVLILGPQPYYWPEGFKFGHSPPLGTRSGWLALGMLPFLVILASKWSLITLVTGVGHEQLNILHRWTAWTMYAASLFHTFPFIVVNINNGVMEQNWWTSGSYWTGVAALVPQTVMMVLAVGVVRNKAYEVFKKVHFVMSIMFVVFLFIHCAGILTSWDYFIALGSLYIFSLLIRWSRVFLRNGFHTAHASLIDTSILHITIPTKLTWSPGQHFLFRFYVGGVSGFSSHPFTVASIPAAGEIELFVRVHEGITARLASCALSKGWMGRVLLDGPYGTEVELGVYDHVLLMAGGSGGSFILGLLRQLAAVPGNAKSITVVYSTRSQDLLMAFKTAFESASLPINTITTLSLHKTAQTTATSSLIPKSSSSLEKSDLPSSITITGRPNLIAAVTSAVSTTEGTLGIACCGHDEFAFDVRKAVTAAQMDVARGRGPKEIFLHTETFGW